MNLSALLQHPAALGLGLLGVGAFLLLVFVLPSLIFPDESVAPPPAPPVDADLTPYLYRRLEGAYRPLSTRLSALEARLEEAGSASVPSAVDLRKLYEGLDGLKRGMDDMRALAGPLSTGARDHEDLRRQVNALTDRARAILSPNAARPPLGAAALEAARAERDSFLRPPPAVAGGTDADLRAALGETERARQAASAEAARLSSEKSDLSAREAGAGAERAALSRAAREARARERLLRRLASWRKAWRDRLAREEASIEQVKRAAEARRADLQARLAQEKARLEADMAALAAGKEGVERERRRLDEEVLRPWREEKARLEADLRAIEGRAAALHQEISALDGERAQASSASTAAAADLRLRAREGQSRWREALRRSEEESRALRSREEDELRSLADAEALEAMGLRAALERTRETVAKERALLAAQEREARDRAGREKEEVLRRLEARRADVKALEESRDALVAAFENDRAERRRETESRRAWAVSRYGHLKEISRRAEESAMAAMDKIRAEKAALLDGSEKEKGLVRRDLSSLEEGAAAERARLEEGRRRAEAEHAAWMTDMSRQEAALRERNAALEKEAASLKADAERFRLKTQERLSRRRAAHERLFVEARVKSEARVVEAEGRLASERAAIQSLEARLAVRRRRMAALRDRRRKALTDLLERARAVLSAADESRRKTESLVQERLAALREGSVQRDLVRRRWAEAPRAVSEAALAAEARMEASSEAELSAVAADAERRQEFVLKLYEENRRELDGAAARLKALEGRLDGEEVAERLLLDAVASQMIRLERLKVFFEAARIPDQAVQSRSQVA